MLDDIDSETKAVFVALIVVLVFAGFARNSSFGNVVTNNQQRVNWVVWEVGVHYYASDSSTDATSIHDSALLATVLTDTIADMATGEELYIKAGSYNLASEVEVDKSISISSGGYGVTITATSAMDSMFRLTEDYICIKDLRLDANDNAEIGLWINGGARCEISRVEVIDAGNNGFEVSFAGTQKTGNKFDRCIGSSADNYNFYLGEEQTDTWITGCTAKANYDDSIAGIAVDCSGTQILNNHLWGNQYGLLLSPTLSATKLMIVGNYIEGNTDANIYNGGTCHSIWDSSITGNAFWSNALDRPEYDILFDVANPYYSARNSITGNNFVGQGNFADYGIYLGTRAVSNTVQSNTFNGFHILAVYGQGDNFVNNNVGWRTEAHGNAVILTGETHIHVPHGLPYIPAIADFNVNLVEEQHVAGNDLVYLALDGTGDTNFIIYQRSAEAEDISVVWNYRRTEYYSP